MQFQDERPGCLTDAELNLFSNFVKDIFWFSLLVTLSSLVSSVFLMSQGNIFSILFRFPSPLVVIFFLGVLFFVFLICWLSIGPKLSPNFARIVYKYASNLHTFEISCVASSVPHSSIAVKLAAASALSPSGTSMVPTAVSQKPMLPLVCCIH